MADPAAGAYSVSIVRTGRVWRQVVLSQALEGSWAAVECGRWCVPGGRWARSKARRVLNRARRVARYSEERVGG